MATLTKNTILSNKYTVLFFIKKGCNAETYRVRGTDGKLYFLKLFNVAQAHRTAFDESILNVLQKALQHDTEQRFQSATECFAKEAGYNFIKVIASDIASIYVHGTQEKIGKLDAMTPDRENTHKPQLIDKAILRAGRLEKLFYIPPPDFEARRAMFELYLKDRP
jgi:hypothetical protein